MSPCMQYGLDITMLRKDLPLCVDTRMIGKNGTGVTTYARGLVAAAAMIDRKTFLLCADNEVDGRIRKWCAAAFATASVRRLRSVPIDEEKPRFIGRDIFRRAHVHFSMHRRFMPVDPPVPTGIMHWTYPIPLRMTGWVNIYTVHDVIPLQDPDLSPVPLGRYRAVMQGLLNTADQIVTVSEAARRDIISLLGFEQARVTNCGQAIAAPPADMPSKAPLGLPADGYFLFCGAVEPRKNLERLILAYKQSGVPQPLVIVGPDGWKASAINARIAGTPNVVRIGYLERTVLLELISHARALLFPSLAEGFGLPVIEAMQLGTPVLTSAFGALAEVANGAALLVDPLDVEALAAGIRTLATNDTLASGLSHQGRARAADFSLARFAARLTTVYDDAAAAYRGSLTGSY